MTTDRFEGPNDPGHEWCFYPSDSDPAKAGITITHEGVYSQDQVFIDRMRRKPRILGPDEIGYVIMNATLRWNSPNQLEEGNDG